MEENEDFLKTQIITYLGNKRKLLPYIEKEIREIKIALNKERLDCADLFSGSGVVARMLKQYSNKLYVNDIETFSRIINECYLTNISEFDKNEYIKGLELINLSLQNLQSGIISSNYAPKDDNNIQNGERCFYTTKNAKIIDTIRAAIDNIKAEYQKYYLAPLLYVSSVHVNTAGTFKGFYKSKQTGKGKFGADGEDSLGRIRKEIKLYPPILSNYECSVFIYQEDANSLVMKLPEVDVAYIDPPYNEHSYGSNYHILNTISLNSLDTNHISKVSGIPSKVNKSSYNSRARIHEVFKDLISNTRAKYLIISYSNEGFISYEEMFDILSQYGKLKVRKINYSTYRASRNLNKRSKYVIEYLFILQKDIEMALLFDIKRKLTPILPYISLATIAKDYFGKSKTWLYHKLNCDVVNGQQYKFTQEEIEILSQALDDISAKIKEVSKSIS